MPSFRTSAFVTPKTRQARSLAANIVHGDVALVVKMACAGGAQRLACPWTTGTGGICAGLPKNPTSDGNVVGDRISPTMYGCASTSISFVCRVKGWISVYVRFRVVRQGDGGDALPVGRLPVVDTLSLVPLDPGP